MAIVGSAQFLVRRTFLIFKSFNSAAVLMAPKRLVETVIYFRHAFDFVQTEAAYQKSGLRQKEKWMRTFAIPVWILRQAILLSLLKRRFRTLRESSNQSSRLRTRFSLSHEDLGVTVWCGRCVIPESRSSTEIQNAYYHTILKRIA